MKTGHQRIAIDLIEMNTGQIDGLPANPRQWTKAQLDNLKASIEETPELLEARGCIVDYHEGKYVCLGGNMRYAACKALGMSELPCYVVPEGTTILKKKQIVAKDNVSMGDWDFDALANEWSDMDLEGWGVPIPPEWGAAAADAAETNSRGQAQDDEFDETEAQIEKKCSKGDIWRLGEHRLMCGDSTDEAAIKRLMDGDKADMVFTDPPYGVSIGDKNAALNSVQPSGRCCKNITEDQFIAHCDERLRQLADEVRGCGMSYYEIAKLTGLDWRTIRKVANEIPVRYDTIERIRFAIEISHTTAIGG